MKIDTPLRKNTVIRKKYLAVVTEQKPRLNQKVACETVGKYKRNQEKMGKFCYEEAKQLKATTKSSPSGTQNSSWILNK